MARDPRTIRRTLWVHQACEGTLFNLYHLYNHITFNLYNVYNHITYSISSISARMMGTQNKRIPPADPRYLPPIVCVCVGVRARSCVRVCARVHVRNWPCLRVCVRVHVRNLALFACVCARARKEFGPVCVCVKAIQGAPRSHSCTPRNLQQTPRYTKPTRKLKKTRQLEKPTRQLQKFTRKLQKPTRKLQIPIKI